jgi:hypothetical protein
MLSLFVSAMILGSVIFTGLATGQQYTDDTQYSVQDQPQLQTPAQAQSIADDNIAEDQSAAVDDDPPPQMAVDDSDILIIPGAEGIKGFTTGANRLSLAIIPVAQKNNQLTFQVIGFAIGSPETGAMAVYSLSKPLMGVIDPSQNTLQVDLSKIDDVIDEAGFIDSSQLYATMRTGPEVAVIDIDMDYQGTEGPQMVFSVNSLDIVPPDGQMQTFSLREPTQLVFDALSHRMYTVAVPQLVDTFNDLYTSTFTEVQPVVYTQPVLISAPVFVPNIVPLPIYATPFIAYNPFFFGSSFVRFYDFDRFHGRFPIHDRYLGRNEFNDFRRTQASFNRVTTGGIRTGDVNINRVGTGDRIGRGEAGIRPGDRVKTPAITGGQGSNIRSGSGNTNRISTGEASRGTNRISTGGISSGTNRISTGGISSGTNRISTGGISSGTNRISSGGISSGTNRISSGGISSGTNRISTGGMTSGTNRIGTGGVSSGANRISSGASTRVSSGGMRSGARASGGGGRRR